MSIQQSASAQRLHQLSRRVGRLRPDWRNPEAFFEERSELERELRRVAREVAGG
jgi:hypothetical protein